MKRLANGSLLVVCLALCCFAATAFAAGSQPQIGSVSYYLESLGLHQQNEGDLVDHDLDYSWGGGDWSLQSRTTYGWDGEGRPTTVLDEMWTGSTYVNDYLSTTTYDGTGAVQTLNQDWGGSAWVNESRSNFQNDGVERPIEIIHQTWNGADWDDETRTRITYETGLMMAEMIIDTLAEGHWVESAKTVYSYSDGNNTELIIYTMTGGEWVAVSRTTFTYDSGLLQEAVTEIWLEIPPNPADWVFASRSTYTYEGSLVTEILIETYSAFFPPIGWATSGRTTFEYDGQNRQTVSIYQTYVATALGWANWSKTESYYESAAVTELEGYPLPDQFSLSQNYPNPFNPGTQIRFALTSSAQVTLEVYDLLGRKVSTLVDQPLAAGTHQVDFDGTNLASGVYFYRLKAGDIEQTRKMLLIK